jgi:hypothetical protein
MLKGIKRKLAVLVPVILASGILLTVTSLFMDYGMDMAFAGGGHN